MILVRSQLNRLLHSLLGSHELVDQWWEGANKGFEGRSPNEVYWSGEAGRQEVTAYILQFCNGAYQ